MIDIATVKNLVEERLEEGMFVVDISVSERNVIHIFIDSFDGLPIDQCIAVSRHVEHSLDREEEDFELQVSSPGLTESFKVPQQFQKYIGKEIEVITSAGEKLKGKLLDIAGNGIVLETSKREKTESHKKKQLVVKQHSLKHEEIKSAKPSISFK